MGRFSPLIIHKNEWERLKNQANPEIKPKKVPPKVNIEAMTEQSRKMMATWSDSVEGHINKLARIKKEKRSKEIAMINAFHKQMEEKRDNTAENLKQARELIFERTGYGKALISALMESKAIEERELQIKFKEETKENETKIEEAKPTVENIMYAAFEKGQENRLIERQQQERAAAECNKFTADTKREEALKTAEIEKKNRLEDAILIEKFNKLQIAEEKQRYCYDEDGVKLYEEQNKAIQNMREKRERQEQMLADLWHKQQDRIRRKAKEVFDEHILAHYCTDGSMCRNKNMST